MALRRLGIAKDARVSYDQAVLDGKAVAVTPEMRAYTLAFGYSLYGRVSSHMHEVMKTLRKTSSDFKTDVSRDRTYPAVKPATFDISALVSR